MWKNQVQVQVQDTKAACSVSSVWHTFVFVLPVYNAGFFKTPQQLRVSHIELGEMSSDCNRQPCAEHRRW